MVSVVTGKACPFSSLWLLAAVGTQRVKAHYRRPLLRSVRDEILLLLHFTGSLLFLYQGYEFQPVFAFLVHHDALQTLQPDNVTTTQVDVFLLS